MRNIHISSDCSYQLPSESGIVACSIDVVREKVYMCNEEGKLFTLDCSESSGVMTECDVNLNMAIEEDEEEGMSSGGMREDNEWFSLTVVPEVSLIVGISHSGCIATLSVIEEPSSSGSYFGPQQDRFEVNCEGSVEGGISTVAWSPDQRFLLLLTNNDSLICMTNSWEVVNEIDYEPRVATVTPVTSGTSSNSSTSCITWRGDSEFFAVYTVDACDGVGKVRVYTKDLMYVGMARDIGDEKISFMRGLVTPVCGFAPSAGGLIAVPRTHKNRHQIALLETSGLHHGEFDLVLPEQSQWEVTFLQWHSSQTMLLVGLQPINTDASALLPVSQRQKCMQLYCRTNYQWQLKQQFTEAGLTCLGFDTEHPYRLYSSHYTIVGNTSTEQTLVFRQIDLRLELTAHDNAYVASNNLVAVTNGLSMNITPIGLAVIPPPMFKYGLAHCSVSRASSFFRVHGAATATAAATSAIRAAATPVSKTSQWGFVSLCDAHWVSLFLSPNEPRGCAPTRSATFSLLDMPARSDVDRLTVKNIVSASGFNCRSIVAVDTMSGSEDGLELFVCILGSHVRPFALHTSECPGDSLLRLHVRLVTDATGGNTVELLHCALRQLPGVATSLITTSALCAGRVCPDRVVVGVIECSFDDHVVFNVYAIDSSRLPTSSSGCSDSCEIDSGMLALGTIPETCCEFSVIPAISNIATSFEGAVDIGHKDGDNDRNHDGCGSVLSTDEEEAKDSIVLIGLTPHGRLYCGETLLCPSASSFVVNLALNMVLFISIGSHTELHFATFQALTMLADSLLNEMQTINTTPRPLERGARLIASVANNTRVIIQLPRGNLEAFDPRPLVIIYAKKLLSEGEYYRCLQLVRKQRVDMNLLYDYSPRSFIAHAEGLVHAAIADQSLDLLSLFISALEPTLFSEYKYTLPTGSANPPTMDGTERGAAVAVAPVTDAATDRLVATALDSATPSAAAASKPASATATTTTTTATPPPIVVNKLNEVCSKMRDIMLPLVLRKVAGTVASTDVSTAAAAAIDISSTSLTALLNPILLTYAKQQPPLLVEALNTVRRVTRAKLSSPSIATSTDTSPSTATTAATVVTEQMIIASPIVTSSVKYLAFIVSHEALFQAALGECDFEFSKAIAHQGQMDPKAYLPLLQKFSDLDNGGNNGSGSAVGLTLADNCSPAYCHMRCRVFLYLSRCSEATAWGMKSLRGTVDYKIKNNNSSDAILSKILAMKKKSVAATATDTPAATSEKDASAEIDYVLLGNDLMDIITKQDGYTAAIEELTALAATCRKNKKKLGKIVEEGVIGSMLRRCRIGYGKQCIKKNKYDEGIASYLAADPVAVDEAIHAAKMANYWNMALTIANRYSSLIESDEYQPNQLAQDICYQFREQLDQAVSESSSVLLVNASSAVSQLVGSALVAGGAVSGTTADTTASEDTMGGDNPVVIAGICVDYTGDVETAVTILLQSKRWLEASELALKKRRIDLFQDEITNNVRETAACVLAELETITARYTGMVTELNAFWADPELRMSNIVTQDSSLQQHLDWRRKAEEGEWGEGGAAMDPHNIQDGASEYSAVSQFSLASNISLASSVKSGVSRGSNTGTTVSLMSKLSSMSSSSQSLQSLNTGPKSTFSIDGVAHSVLSRGSHKKEGKEAKAESDKMKKKNQRRDAKIGRDLFKLKREGELADELAALADVSSMVTLLINLCNTLLLVNTPKDLELLASIMDRMGSFITTVQATLPVIAPDYPLEWLEKRSLMSIVLFQDKEQRSLIDFSKLSSDPDAVVAAAVHGHAVAHVAGTGGAGPVHNAVETWWEHVIKGVHLWVRKSNKFKTFYVSK